MKKNNLTVNRLKDRLKEDLKKESSNKTLSVDGFLKEEDLKDVIDFNSITEISTSDEINSFLKEQTIKLFNTQSKNALMLGEIFSVVHEKLSSPGSEEGIYEKWLEINNFNKTTAWRYRQRYFLYSKVESNKKNIVATLPYSLINELLKNQDIDGCVKLINNSLDKKDLLQILSSSEKKIENRSEKDIVEFKGLEIKNYIPLFENLEERVNKLDDKKKKELQKHLNIIEKLLNS